MKRRSIVKSILYTLGGLVIVLSISIWAFLSFYFEETLNKVVIPKIELAAFKATHGRFILTLDKIYYNRGALESNTFILWRVGYDTSEHGMVLDRITLDSARFEGISWWDVVWGNDLTLVSLELNSPKLYMADIGTDTTLRRVASRSYKPTSTAQKIPVISFDSIVLRSISVFLPEQSGNSMQPAYRNMTIKLTDFLLDLQSNAPQRVLFSKRIDFDLPGGIYSIGDSMYSVEARGISGSFSDSLVTIDSIAYLPNYSEQDFADMHKYIQGRLELRCRGINIRGIDFTKLLNGGELNIRACEAALWSVDYFGDRRKPRNMHPPDAMLPNAILRTIKAPVFLDSIILDNGTIRHRERATGSTQPSLITFTRTHVIAHPFCTDTSNKLCDAPVNISFSAIFMGQGRVNGTVIYPIHHRSFDLQVAATVGPFDLPVLNSYLITNERKEVMSGKCLGGELKMDVRSGMSTTTVSPRYSDLNMKVLATDAKQSGGIFEGIKSFLANTFVLRTNNLDEGDKKAFSGTTTYVYSKKEEFFEFIWLALRKSIGKVVGF